MDEKENISSTSIHHSSLNNLLNAFFSDETQGNINYLMEKKDLSEKDIKLIDNYVSNCDKIFLLHYLLEKEHLEDTFSDYEAELVSMTENNLKKHKLNFHLWGVEKDKRYINSLLETSKPRETVIVEMGKYITKLEEIDSLYSKMHKNELIPLNLDESRNMMSLASLKGRLERFIDLYNVAEYESK